MKLNKWTKRKEKKKIRIKLENVTSVRAKKSSVNETEVFEN